MRKLLILTLSLVLLAGFSFGAVADMTDLSLDISGLDGVESNLQYGNIGRKVDVNLHVNKGIGGLIYSGTGYQEGTVKVMDPDGTAIQMQPNVAFSGSEEDLTAMAYSDDPGSTDRVIGIVSATGADEGHLGYFQWDTKTASYGMITLSPMTHKDDHGVRAKDTTGGDVTLLTGFWVQNKWVDMSSENASLLGIESLTVKSSATEDAEGHQWWDGRIQGFVPAAGPGAIGVAEGGFYSEPLGGSEATANTFILIDSVDLEVTASATWDGTGYFANLPEVTEP